MTRPTISTVPVPPARLDGAATFSPGMETFMAGVQAFATEADALGAWAETQDPLKCAFVATASADWTPTGAAEETPAAGSWVGGQIPFDTEALDIGGCFASSVFTAPAAGVYVFGLSARQGTASAAAIMKIGIRDVSAGVYRATANVWSSRHLACTALMSLASGAQVDARCIYLLSGSSTRLTAGTQFWGRRLA